MTKASWLFFIATLFGWGSRLGGKNTGIVDSEETHAAPNKKIMRPLARILAAIELRHIKSY